jgi:hypothetical protein
LFDKKVNLYTMAAYNPPFRPLNFEELTDQPLLLGERYELHLFDTTSGTHTYVISTLTEIQDINVDFPGTGLPPGTLQLTFTPLEKISGTGDFMHHAAPTGYVFNYAPNIIPFIPSHVRFRTEGEPELTFDVLGIVSVGKETMNMNNFKHSQGSRELELKLPVELTRQIEKFGLKKLPKFGGKRSKQRRKKSKRTRSSTKKRKINGFLK